MHKKTKPTQRRTLTDAAFVTRVNTHSHAAQLCFLFSDKIHSMSLVYKLKFMERGKFFDFDGMGIQQEVRTFSGGPRGGPHGGPHGGQCRQGRKGSAGVAGQA